MKTIPSLAGKVAVVTGASRGVGAGNATLLGEQGATVDVTGRTTGKTLEIGFIGAGNIGAGLARKLKDARHTVRIANSRGPDTLADLAMEVGATAVSVVDVAKQSDVLIISVPMKAIQQFPANLFDSARHGLIVVDTGNYYSMRDGRIEPLESVFSFGYEAVSPGGMNLLNCLIGIVNRENQNFCLGPVP